MYAINDNNKDIVIDLRIDEHWAIITDEGVCVDVHKGVRGHAMDRAAAKTKQSVRDGHTTHYTIRAATDEEINLYV